MIIYFLSIIKSEVSEMKLYQIDYLLEVCKHGSFSKAADALLVSRPAISRAMKDLEDEFGITIFQRTTTGVVPTEAVEIILDKSKKISHLLGELERIADYYILIDDGIIMECIGSDDLEKRLSERISVTFFGNPSDAAENAAKCVAAGGCASYEITGNKCVLYGPFNYGITAGFLGGFDIESFRTEDGNLENYFVSQVGEK